MQRTTAPCDTGRIVTYASADGEYSAHTRPIGSGWAVTVEGELTPTLRIGYVGTFRSEREAMDQARSRIKHYEQTVKEQDRG